MGMYAILCSMSPKRRRMIEHDEELLGELVEARHDGDIPGLLDLDSAWDPLDLVLVESGGDPDLLGDAVLARSGEKMGKGLGFGPAKLLAPARVRLVSAALAALPADFIARHLPSVRARGEEGLATENGRWLRGRVEHLQRVEVKALGDHFERLRELYARAAERGESVLSVIA